MITILYALRQKMGVFSKTNVMIKFMQKTSRCLIKRTQILLLIFWRKYFENQNIGPYNKKTAANCFTDGRRKKARPAPTLLSRVFCGHPHPCCPAVQKKDYIDEYGRI
jgi:hypothetical protein